jgi:hypothetical protein
MGLFGKRVRECDWCGRAIEGAGIVDGELVLCSATCLDHKNHPAAASARTVPDLHNATAGLAAAELAIAATELQLYESIAAAVTAQTDADTIERGRNAYFTLWRQLTNVRRVIASRGADLREFDRLHRSYLDNAEVVDVSRAPRPVVLGDPFPPADRERARAALASLQAAVALLSRG